MNKLIVWLFDIDYFYLVNNAEKNIPVVKYLFAPSFQAMIFHFIFSFGIFQFTINNKIRVFLQNPLPMPFFKTICADRLVALCGFPQHAMDAWQMCSDVAGPMTLA